jgi:hypothetical protein
MERITKPWWRSKHKQSQTSKQIIEWNEREMKWREEGEEWEGTKKKGMKNNY